MGIAELTIEWIRERARSGNYLITLHADSERRSDGIELDDLIEALGTGVILEDYPDDPRGHSCLVFGKTGGKDIHVVCGRRYDRLAIITVYVPKPPQWPAPDTRRKIS